MTTIFRDLSQLWTLIHCCIMFMFLYESRYSQTKTNIITGIFTIPLVIANMISVLTLGIERAGQLIIFTCVLPSFIFFFIMSKNRDTRFLFTFCVVDTIVLEVLFATNLLDTFLGLGNYIVMFISRLIIYPALEFLIVKYLRTPYHLLQQQLKKGWLTFSIMAVLFYITMLLVTYYPNIILDRPQYYPYLIMILILVPVMYITVFKVLWTQLKLFRAAEENRILALQMKMVQERLSSGSETEHRLKLLRHDMKHKMLLLGDYIKNKKLDEAETYINSLINDIDKNTLKNYCDNNSVNVVLSYYNRIADEKSIKFETNIRLPESLPISETDLAVVLSNGLENSINALESCDYKRIIIEGFLDNGKIYLEIKNPFNGNILFDDNLPKSDKENHGYGTKSMATIIENNAGIYSFTIEGGFFVFRCAV